MGAPQRGRGRRRRALLAAVTALAVVVLGVRTAGPATAATAPYWLADFEEGPCGTAVCYTDWSFVQAEDPSLAVTSLNAVVKATKVGIVAHRGRFVGQFAVTAAALAAGKPHSKVFKEWLFPGATPKNDQYGRLEQALPATGINGSYRAWFWFPADYVYAGQGWTNIFQFKLGEQDPYRQDPEWWVNVVGGQDGAPASTPYLFVNHWYGNVISDARPLPLGRWFELRADLYEGDRIDWYLDGQYWQTVHDSTHPIGRDYAVGTPQNWIFGVGHYSGVGRLYVDDASFTPF